MQNLLNDVHPEFATAEQAYIAEFNVERNGYDERVGPCFHKRILVDPQAHRSGWVPLEEIHEEDLHPDVFTLPATYDEDADEDYDTLFGTFDETCEAFGPEPKDHYDKFAVMARRFGCYYVQEQPLEMSREVVINLFHAHDDFAEDGEVEGVDAETREPFYLYGECVDDRIDCCMKEEFLPSHVGNHVPIVAHHNWRCRLNEDPRRGMSHGKWRTKADKPWLASRATIRHMQHM